jgi:hypothetical protein
VSDPVRAGATTFDPAADPTATVGTSLRVDRFWDLVAGAVAMLA